MKTFLRFIPKGKKSYLISGKKKGIKIPSSKLTKLPKQKVGVSREILTQKQIETRSKKLGDISHRMVLGKDTPTTHLGEEAVRGQDIAYKLSEKRFSKNLSKYFKQARKEVATIVKQSGHNARSQFRPKKIIPKYVVPDALRRTGSYVAENTKVSRLTGKKINPQGKVFIKKHKQKYQTITGQPRLVRSRKLESLITKKSQAAYKKASADADKLFRKTTERFSGRSLTSSTKIRTAPSRPTLDYREKAQQRQMTESWGKDPDARPDFDSDIMLGGKTNRNFKMKKKKYFYKGGFKIDREID